MTVNGRIKSLLESHHVNYREIHHAPTHTSEESAKARGESLKIGGKALLIKVDEEFIIFVMSASRRINSVKIKRYFKAKKIRFASAEELKKLTGLTPGSVPPFGRPVLDFKLYVDESITWNQKIAFNAGLLTDSIIISVDDYLTVANPTIFLFSKPGQ